MALLFVRFLCLVSLVFLTYSGLWWLLVPATMAYLVRFDGYEVLAFAFCLDVYFMTTTFVPVYTGGTIALLILMSLLRPSFRNQHSL